MAHPTEKLFVHYFQTELKFEMLVFVGEGKPENPEKNPQDKPRTNNKLNPHMTPGPVFNPGHAGVRQALLPLYHHSPLPLANSKDSYFKSFVSIPCYKLWSGGLKNPLITHLDDKIKSFCRK